MSDKNLFQRLLAIQDKVRYIQKGGYNSFHKYKYVQEADIIEAVKTAAIEEGVFLAFSMLDTGTVAQADKGDIISYVTTELTATNVDNPQEYMTIKGGGHGSDKLDKGIYKALTGANKYMLSKLFQIATGDDPEVDEKPTKSEKKEVKDITAVRDIIVDELTRCKNIIAFNALNKRWETAYPSYDPNDPVVDEIETMLAKRKEKIQNEEAKAKTPEPNEPAELLDKVLDVKDEFLEFVDAISGVESVEALDKIANDLKANTTIPDERKDILRKNWKAKKKELGK